MMWIQLDWIVHPQAWLNFHKWNKIKAFYAYIILLLKKQDKEIRKKIIFHLNIKENRMENHGHNNSYKYATHMPKNKLIRI